MTLNDLVELYRENSWHPNIHIHPDEKAGIRAVVEALRDEMDRQRGDDWRWGDTVYFFNEILGDAGEKVAGACADGTVVQRQRYGENDRQSKDGAGVSPRHPDPATDPCPHCKGEGCTPHLDCKGNVYPEPCQHCETTGRVPATDPAPVFIDECAPVSAEAWLSLKRRTAPAVCEWTPQDEGPAHEIWKTACGTMYERAKSTGWCNKCKAPIKFTEAKT